MKAAKHLIKGNTAVVLAALDAGCRFYAGYPITPQNEIPELMSSMMPEAGGVFIQAESELISINMVFGASVSGTRAMTTSSSPGISLMQEGISYMAGCELPAVIVNMMRGGPGLGNIAPSQSDYFQAVKPGHGDYHLIVLAPHNTEDIYNYTFDAFDLADKYRMPVMILGDGLMAQLMENTELDRTRKPKLLNAPKPWALTGAAGRRGQRIVSLLMKPGALEEHNMELKKKYDTIKKEETKYELTNTGSKPDYLIAAFGSCARISKDVVKMAEADGIKIGLFRPITLWPYPYDALKAAADGVKKIFVFEMNLGQMVEDVKLAVENSSKVEFYGRPGGGVPTAEELYDFIKRTVK